MQPDTGEIDILGFWGKARPVEPSRGPGWHPLAFHGLDVAAVGEALLTRHQGLKSASCPASSAWRRKKRFGWFGSCSVCTTSASSPNSSRRRCRISTRTASVTIPPACGRTTTTAPADCDCSVPTPTSSACRARTMPASGGPCSPQSWVITESRRASTRTTAAWQYGARSAGRASRLRSRSSGGRMSSWIPLQDCRLSNAAG